MANSETVQSVQRALDMLEQIGRADGGLRLSELAASLRLKRTTAHNLLRTLRTRGFVAQDHARRYRWGPMFDELTRLRYRQGIFRRAGDAMRRLHARFPRATVTFSELSGQEIVCRLRMAPEIPGTLQHPVSQTLSAFGSASGLCLYALNPEYRDLMASRGGFSESGSRAWSTRRAFDEAVAQTVRRGMALIAGESCCRLAAPVGDHYVLGLSLDRACDNGHSEGLTRAPAYAGVGAIQTMCRELTATAAAIAESIETDNKEGEPPCQR